MVKLVQQVQVIGWRWMRKLPVSDIGKIRLMQFTNERFLSRCEPRYGTDHPMYEMQMSAIQRRFDLRDELAEALEHRAHKKLYKRATTLEIPFPAPFDDQGQVTDHFYRLTSGPQQWVVFNIEAKKELRQAIREEEKHRSDKRARAIPYLTALSGLISACSAALAVYLSMTKDDAQRPKYPDATTQEHRPATTPSDDASRRVAPVGGRASGS